MSLEMHDKFYTWDKEATLLLLARIRVWAERLLKSNTPFLIYQGQRR